MTFKTIKPQSGLLTFGQPSEWEWTRKGGHYFAYRDFFCVHWEVHHPEGKPEFAHSVRLHVESPNFIKDPELNNLKRQVVEAFSNPGVEQAVQKAGMTFKKGKFISESNVRRTQCTEAFRVTLPLDELKSKPEENIEKVHAALKSEIQAILRPFIEDLNRQFGI